MPPVNLQNTLSQLQKLPADQQQLLGLAPSQEQVDQRKKIEDALSRITTLKGQFAATGVPSEQEAQLGSLIEQQQRQLEKLTPKSLLETSPTFKDVGISQAALERETAAAREPIASGLADLLLSRSIIGRQRESKQQAVQAQISSEQDLLELQKALQDLNKPSQLPQSITTNLLSQLLTPQKADTQITEIGGNKVLVDTQTGKVIRTLGPSAAVGPGGIKEATQAERVATGYATRASESSNIIDQFGSKFTSAASYLGQNVPNILKSSDRQQFEQAQRNFINAVLRKESGAVISEQEFANARQQYFPQPGDSPAVVEQKKKNRETTIGNLRLEGGQVAGQPTGTAVTGGTIIRGGASWQKNADGTYTRVK